LDGWPALCLYYGLHSHSVKSLIIVSMNGKICCHHPVIFFKLFGSEKASEGSTLNMKILPNLFPVLNHKTPPRGQILNSHIYYDNEATTAAGI
jgi:hypothetical protein